MRSIVKSIYTPHLWMDSKKFLDTLSEEHRTLIQNTFEEVKIFQRKLIREGEEEILKKLPGKGVSVFTLSDEELRKWVEKTKPVYNEVEKRIGKDLIEEVRKTIRNRK